MMFLPLLLLKSLVQVTRLFQCTTLVPISPCEFMPESLCLIIIVIIIIIIILQFVYICLLGPETMALSHQRNACSIYLIERPLLRIQCYQSAVFWTQSKLFIAWDFAKLFFRAFLNSKGTYNNGNYHCSHLPRTCYFSLYLDSFSNTLREVYYYYYYYYYYYCVFVITSGILVISA